MRKRERFRFILLVLACLGIAAALSLYAMRKNISYFFAPSEIAALRKAGDARVQPGHVFRLGGLVKDGSLKKTGKDLAIRFIVTDNIAELAVEYKGITPDLFREGQGVVAKGSLDDEGKIFAATELLAKHDEKYTPPELAKKMKELHDKGTGK